MFRTAAAGIAVAIAWAPVQPVSGQDKSPAVEAAPIVVSATRLPVPADAVASTVTVITAETIARRQFRSVVEALETVPSLSVVRNGAPGKLTAVFTRGANAQHTLFIIDGIEMNDPSHPSSAFDPAHVLIQDVERIEVLLGPQSTLYGSDAVGGVVSIVTKRGVGKTQMAGTLETGSFSTFNQNASVRGAHGPVDFSVSAQHVKTGGISTLPNQFAQPDGTLDDDEHENLTLSTRVGLTPNEILAFDVSGRYAFTRDGTDARIFATGDDSDSVSRSNRYYLGGNLRLTLFDGLSEHRIGVAHTDIDRRDKNNVDLQNPADEFDSDNGAQRTKFDLQNDLYLGEHHVVTLGLETKEERTETRFVSPGFVSSTSADVRTNSMYLQDQLTYFGNLTGTIGIRRDDHSSFGAENTWRAALAYRFTSSGTKVRASYGTGFKAPSIVQLFGRSASAFGVFVGNPNLVPEESRGWEVGVEQALWAGRSQASVSYFENDIKNLIVAGAVSNSNIGKAATRGLEASVNVEFGPAFRLDLTYALVRSENAVTNTDLLRRPLHTATLDARWQVTDKAQISLSGLLVGRRFDIDAATFARVKRGTDVTFNLLGAYRVNRQIELFGRIENLLDRDYEDPDGFQQPGIAGYAGVRVRY